MGKSGFGEKKASRLIRTQRRTGDAASESRRINLLARPAVGLQDGVTSDAMKTPLGKVAGEKSAPRLPMHRENPTFGTTPNLSLYRGAFGEKTGAGTL